MRPATARLLAYVVLGSAAYFLFARKQSGTPYGGGFTAPLSKDAPPSVAPLSSAAPSPSASKAPIPPDAYGSASPPSKFAPELYEPHYGHLLKVRTPNTFAKNAAGANVLTSFTVVMVTSLKDGVIEGRAQYYVFPDGSKAPAPPNTPFVHFTAENVEDFATPLGGGGGGMGV